MGFKKGKKPGNGRSQKHNAKAAKKQRKVETPTFIEEPKFGSNRSSRERLRSRRRERSREEASDNKTNSDSQSNDDTANECPPANGPSGKIDSTSDPSCPKCWDEDVTPPHFNVESSASSEELGETSVPVHAPEHETSDKRSGTDEEALDVNPLTGKPVSQVCELEEATARSCRSSSGGTKDQAGEVGRDHVRSPEAVRGEKGFLPASPQLRESSVGERRNVYGSEPSCEIASVDKKVRQKSQAASCDRIFSAAPPREAIPSEVLDPNRLLYRASRGPPSPTVIPGEGEGRGFFSGPQPEPDFEADSAPASNAQTFSPNAIMTIKGRVEHIELGHPNSHDEDPPALPRDSSVEHRQHERNIASDSMESPVREPSCSSELLELKASLESFLSQQPHQNNLHSPCVVSDKSRSEASAAAPNNVASMESPLESLRVDSSDPMDSQHNSALARSHEVVDVRPSTFSPPAQSHTAGSEVESEAIEARALYNKDSEPNYDLFHGTISHSPGELREFVPETSPDPAEVHDEDVKQAEDLHARIPHNMRMSSPVSSSPALPAVHSTISSVPRDETDHRSTNQRAFAEAGRSGHDEDCSISSDSGKVDLLDKTSNPDRGDKAQSIATDQRVEETKHRYAMWQNTRQDQMDQSAPDSLPSSKAAMSPKSPGCMPNRAVEYERLVQRPQDRDQSSFDGLEHLHRHDSSPAPMPKENFTSTRLITADKETLGKDTVEPTRGVRDPKHNDGALSANSGIASGSKRPSPAAANPKLSMGKSDNCCSSPGAQPISAAGNQSYKMSNIAHGKSFDTCRSQWHCNFDPNMSKQVPNGVQTREQQVEDGHPVAQQSCSSNASMRGPILQDNIQGQARTEGAFSLGQDGPSPSGQQGAVVPENGQRGNNQSIEYHTGRFDRHEIPSTTRSPRGVERPLSSVNSSNTPPRCDEIRDMTTTPKSRRAEESRAASLFTEAAEPSPPVQMSSSQTSPQNPIKAADIIDAMEAQTVFGQRNCDSLPSTSRDLRRGSGRSADPSCEERLPQREATAEETELLLQLELPDELLEEIAERELDGDSSGNEAGKELLLIQIPADLLDEVETIEKARALADCGELQLPGAWNSSVNSTDELLGLLKESSGPSDANDIDADTEEVINGFICHLDLGDSDRVRITNHSTRERTRKLPAAPTNADHRHPLFSKADHRHPLSPSLAFLNEYQNRAAKGDDAYIRWAHERLMGRGDPSLYPIGPDPYVMKTFNEWGKPSASRGPPVAARLDNQRRRERRPQMVTTIPEESQENRVESMGSPINIETSGHLVRDSLGGHRRYRVAPAGSPTNIEPVPGGRIGQISNVLALSIDTVPPTAVLHGPTLGNLSIEPDIESDFTFSPRAVGVNDDEPSDDESVGNGPLSAEALVREEIQLDEAAWPHTSEQNGIEGDTSGRSSTSDIERETGRCHSSMKRCGRGFMQRVKFWGNASVGCISHRMQRMHQDAFDDALRGRREAERRMRRHAFGEYRNIWRDGVDQG